MCGTSKKHMWEKIAKSSVQILCSNVVYGEFYTFHISLSFFSCFVCYSCSIVCIFVDAASVSDDAEHNTQSSKASTVMDFLKIKHTKRDFNAQSTDRNRRLIPYVMVYLPTTNRQYVPFASPYDVNQAVSAILFIHPSVYQSITKS